MPNSTVRQNSETDSVVELAVLMAAHNEAHCIGMAIESILAQTYTHFRFYIVNDCSTDATESIIYSYAKMDNRITVINNEKNLKLASSLNRAISISKEPYIARMDADDISHPERLEKQMSFLKANPHIDVCGTGYRVPETGYVVFNPMHDDDIRARMIFGCELVHPSVVLKRTVFDEIGGYPIVSPCEDYTLWIELILAFKRYVFANIPSCLITYSWKNYLQGNTEYMQRTHNQTWIVRKRFLSDGFNIPEERVDLQSHFYLCNGYDESILSAEDIKKVTVHFSASYFLLRLWHTCSQHRGGVDAHRT